MGRLCSGKAVRDDDWKARLVNLGVKRKRNPPRGAAPASATALREGTSPTTTAAGRRGEDEAVRHLTARGVTVLARNVRYPDGEIDVVAEHEGVLLFVEVKWRRTPARGSAAESVTPRKRARLVRAARRYLAGNPGRPRPVRFDVVAIEEEPPRVSWIQGAFEAA